VNLLGRVKVKRCAEGERLYQKWLAALEKHVTSEIYFAMQSYYFHKNGIRNYEGEIQVAGCQGCGFTTKEN
jgi:hypothetical protein